MDNGAAWISFCVPSMKITFVSAPLNMSGGQRVMAIYAQYLQRLGHEVLVVAPPRAAGGKWADRLRLTGIWQPASRGLHPSHLDGSGVPVKLLPRCRAVRAEDVPDADLIIATWWETAEWVSKMPASKGRWVYLVQHHEVFDYLPVERVAATYRLPMQKVVVAEWLARVMAQHYGDTTSVVVPNAIDLEQFHSPVRVRQARPTLATLFHETPFKGFDVTLQVIEAVRAEIPELRVVAFGTDPARHFADKMADIDLTLAPPQDRIRELYAQSDVWLSCSRSEGFNLTAMEAMACRTPVVSTRTGWPEAAVRRGVNGALAEVEDVEGLAQAVIEILRLDDAQWQRLSEGAFETVKNVSWEAAGRQFLSVLNDVAARGVAGGLA